MTAFEIEEVRNVDAVWQDLTMLFAALYEHHVPLGSPPLIPDWQRRWRGQLGNPGERLILVGRLDGTAVGLLNSRIQRTSGLYQEAFGFVEDAYVAPEQRGSGLAQAMLQRTEQWCRTHGIDLLRLSVLAKNDLGVHFWEKSGFTPLMHIVSKNLSEATP